MPLQPERNYPPVILSGYIILEKDSQVLMLRRFNTGYHDGDYSLPAGHLEAGEFASLGTVREVAEEIGIILKQQDITIAHIMHRLCDDHERVDFFFKPTKWNGTPRNVEPHRCDDASWFPLDKLPANIVPYVKVALEKYRSGEFYSEFSEAENTVFTK